MAVFLIVGVQIESNFKKTYETIKILCTGKLIKVVYYLQKKHKIGTVNICEI